MTNRTVVAMQEERIRIALAVEQMLLAFGFSQKEAADAGEDCLEEDEFEAELNEVAETVEAKEEPSSGSPESFEDFLKWLHEEQLECR